MAKTFLSYLVRQPASPTFDLIDGDREIVNPMTCQEVPALFQTVSNDDWPDGCNRPSGVSG